MLARIDLRGAQAVPPGSLPRAALDVDAAVETVRPIVAEIRDHGAQALRALTRRFDDVDLETPRVDPSHLASALDNLDPDVRGALTEAATRARTVHTAARPADVVVDVVPGGRVRERHVPVRRVGLYVPGGLVAYPSSVVMNVVPAQVAGVEQIAVASPPQADGRPHPAVLAACALLGIDEVYAVGGAQAIAMFAFGIADLEIAPVDVITGPGNVYVAAAKRLVRGRVGIDAEAGPTEIAILADDTADPALVAADLVAQAEHDPLAACLLVTPSPHLADAVDSELETLIPKTTHHERVVTALSGQSATVLVDDLDHGVAIVDAWAPEHFELITVDARERAETVTNAGAVFVGAFSPVSLGDYLAGSNHVLPTGGTARYAAGLSTATFLRAVHIVDYTRDALATAAPHIRALGAAEDLPAHVDAVLARLQ